MFDFRHCSGTEGVVVATVGGDDHDIFQPNATESTELLEDVDARDAGQVHVAEHAVALDDDEPRRTKGARRGGVGGGGGG